MLHIDLVAVSYILQGKVDVLQIDIPGFEEVITQCWSEDPNIRRIESSMQLITKSTDYNSSDNVPIEMCM